MENSGKTFGGEWKLKIHSSLDCLLEEYSLDFTKNLNPRDADSDNDGILDGVEVNPEENNGWITNPAKRDTDGDNINDKYEIDRGWNPNSRDTDGDGVEDWADADPLHNLIVMVRVNTAKYDDIFQIFNPTLQVTLEVEADPDHKWEVATPSAVATGGNRPIIIYLPWIYWYCWTSCITIPWLDCYWIKKCASTWLGKICWWALRCRWRSYTICTRFCVPYPGLKPFTVGSVNTIANFNDEYYFDVDDGDTDISIKAELWKFYLLGWLPHVDGVINHNFMKPDYEMNTQHRRIYRGSNYIDISIETKGIPRVNTVAVYENGTFYNGHYSAIEKMTVVLLDVNSGTDPNFVDGINAILIPTSVFTNSKLHKIIETIELVDGVVSDLSWSNIPSCLQYAEVAGINREVLKDSISPNVECVITKALSAQDAYDLLLLAVTSANETEGIIYEYTNNYIAESLGVASDVLELIPLNMQGYQNSEVGEWPRTPWQNFVQLIVDIIQFVIDVLLAIGEFFVALFEWIFEIGMNMVKAVTQFILDVVELMVKAIILVFIYLVFAIELLMVLLVFVSLIAIFLIIGPIIQADNVEVTITSVSIEKGEKFLEFSYSLGIEKWDLLDLDIPTIYYNFGTEKGTVEVITNFNEVFGLPPMSDILNELGPEFPEVNNPTIPLESVEQIPQTSDVGTFEMDEFLGGLFLSADVHGILFTILGAIFIALPVKYQILPFLVSVVTFIITAVILLKTKATENTMTEEYYYGLIAGAPISFALAMVAAGIANSVMGKKKKTPEDLADFGTKLSIYGAILAAIGSVIAIFDYYEEKHAGTDIDYSGIGLESWLEGGLGFTGIILGGILIGIDSDYKTNTLLFGITSGITLILSIVLPLMLYTITP